MRVSVKCRAVKSRFNLYDRIDREGLWTVLRLYGLGGRLLKGVKSFYMKSRACVRVGNGVSDWFPVRVCLRQGCVMSPWLFNVCIWMVL